MHAEIYFCCFSEIQVELGILYLIILSGKSSLRELKLECNGGGVSEERREKGTKCLRNTA